MTGTIPLAVEMRGVIKRFGAATANAGVDLQVARGTIHGIVGENGAGKSTAMNLLFGKYRSDAGEVLLDGNVRRWRSPAEAIAAGIGMVHQHFLLGGPHTALENIILGAEPRRHGFIDTARARADLELLAQAHHLPVPWDTPVDQLPVGIQQRVEILKALYRQARVLILDEPTAVLTPSEADHLLAGLREFVKSGRTVLLVTHKLREVLSWTDQLTVFRAGRTVATLRTKETTAEAVAEKMIGRKVDLKVRWPPGTPTTECLLEVRHLTTAHPGKGLQDISISARAGEIVGIAGVEGNGQSELVRTILSPAEQDLRGGEISWLGTSALRLNSAQVRGLGVASIPEDRISKGLLTEATVQENFILGHQRRSEYSSFGVLKRLAINAAALRVLEDNDVRPADVSVPARVLSGGNQQKLIFGRELHGQPRFIVACQPTRGVDLGAAQFIHEQLVRCRDRGAGVLLVSSELEEILALSDRILVMYGGRIVAEYGRQEATEAELGLRMGGV